MVRVMVTKMLLLWSNRVTVMMSGGHEFHVSSSSDNNITTFSRWYDNILKKTANFLLQKIT